jgi:O-antigen/teichoic acid export membrane protein
MRALVHRISTTAKSDRVFTWLKLISITGSAQILIQMMGLASGILIIRLLSTEQYGLYTLANTMLGTMIILADGGISSGVMSNGGKVWQDKNKLGVVLVTGLDLRKKFAVGSLIVAIPILVYMLRIHGAGWLMCLLIVIGLVPAFFTALSGTLFQIVPMLNQDIYPLQKINVISNLTRMVTLLSLFIFPWAFVAMLAYGLPQIWVNINLRKISAKYADWNQKPDPVVRKALLSFVKRILPGAIYFCVSGQISIWLISVFGSTSSVPQVGALGRLTVLISTFNVIFTTLVLPRYARLPEKKTLVLTRFFQIELSLILLSCGIVTLVWLFPSQILWVLGKNYANLQTELVLSFIGSCLGLIGGVSCGLFINRGWAINPVISICFSILSIAIGVMLMDVSTLRGVLYLNIFIAIIQVLMNGLYALYKILKMEDNTYHKTG